MPISSTQGCPFEIVRGLGYQGFLLSSLCLRFLLKLVLGFFKFHHFKLICFKVFPWALRGIQVINVAFGCPLLPHFSLPVTMRSTLG